MREVTSHKVNGLNEAIKIETLGEPGPGGAHQHYEISHPVGKVTCRLVMHFQQGNPAEEINGISNEALLAIVEDRLLGFQNGPFKTREGAVALTKIQEAMMWLQRRTRDRLARGVEGTTQQ